MGSWRLVGVLHESASAQVWEAENVRLGARVAIKFYRNGRAAVGERAICQVRSPHIVQVLDHGIHAGVHYLVMELLEGEDLGRLLARERQLRLKETARVIDHVGRALQSVHDAGFGYGRLKPEQVFVIHEDDGGLFVKLLDFDGQNDALAALHAGDSFESTLIAAVAIPHFCSPEQLERGAVPDPRSDVWALGALTYRMLTGVPPFAAASSPDVYARLRSGDVSSVRIHKADLPLELDELFRQTFQVDPKARLPSVRAVSFGLYAIAKAQGERLSDWIEVPLPKHVQVQDARSITRSTLVARIPSSKTLTWLLSACVSLGLLFWWSLRRSSEPEAVDSNSALRALPPQRQPAGAAGTQATVPKSQPQSVQAGARACAAWPYPAGGACAGADSQAAEAHSEPPPLPAAPKRIAPKRPKAALPEKPEKDVWGF